MRSDAAIAVRDLVKVYRIFGHAGDRIKQAATFGRVRFHQEYTALKGVSFEISKGESVGIIGRNGSGKSTLLQVVSGILRPTSGSVRVNGRVSALLELGAGFSPEFTGRENVYFQGAVMGLTKAEMDDRFGAIAAFADIGPFIDQPVRIYSSGMFVRLAFAVAVNVDPDVLIVDEALGVGDMEFQERSLSRMKQLQGNGTTVLLVTHSMPAVRNFCQRAIWLDGGSVVMAGDADKVCIAYQEHVDRSLHGQALDASATGSRERHASGREKLIALIDVAVDDARLAVGDSLTIRFALKLSDRLEPSMEFGLGVLVHNAHGRLVAVFNTVRDDISLNRDVQCVSLVMPRVCFVPGQYWISVNVCDDKALFAYDEMKRCASFEVANEVNGFGIPRWEGEVACEHAWVR